MSLNNALFLVDRGGTNYKVSGANIGSKIRNGDCVLVQRSSNHFKATYGSSSWDKIQDNDLILAWDGSNNRKVKGSNFKALFLSASISSSHSTVYSGQTYRISWNCSGGDYYNLRLSNGLVWNNVKASETWNFEASSSGRDLTFTIEVLNASGSVLISDSVDVKEIAVSASISSSKSTVAEGETFRISWTASGGSSYRLHDSYDGSRYTVNANSSKDFTGKSRASTRTFTIEVYNSSGTKIETAGFNVRELGSGYRWIYGASVPLGQSGKWSHGDDKTKFHNTDEDGNYVESWWRSFSAGTRKIKLDGTYQDFYFPSPSSVGSGTGKSTHFSKLNLSGGMGKELIIFNR